MLIKISNFKLWFGDNGSLTDFVGGYDDAMMQGAKLFDPEAVVAKDEKKSEVTTPAVKSEIQKPKKLSFKLQRELDELPKTMEKLEHQIADLQEQINQSDFFNQSAELTQPVYQALSQAEAQLEVCFERWEELEAMS